MVFATSLLSGVNVAIRPVAASIVTLSATKGIKVGAGPVIIKVVVFTLAGSIRKPVGTVKVALIFESKQTIGAPARGLVDSTEILAAGMAAVVVKLH